MIGTECGIPHIYSFHFIPYFITLLIDKSILSARSNMFFFGNILNNFQQKCNLDKNVIKAIMFTH